MNGTPLDYLRGRYQEGRLIPFSGAGTPRSAVELLAAMGIDISDRHWVALANALLESPGTSREGAGRLGLASIGLRAPAIDVPDCDRPLHG